MNACIPASSEQIIYQRTEWKKVVCECNIEILIYVILFTSVLDPSSASSLGYFSWFYKISLNSRVDFNCVLRLQVFFLFLSNP